MKFYLLRSFTSMLSIFLVSCNNETPKVNDSFTVESVSDNSTKYQYYRVVRINETGERFFVVSHSQGVSVTQMSSKK